MKHTPQGTTIERGDPHLITFINGNCPVCGRKLADDPERCLYTGGGHLKSVFGFNVSFAACSEHFEEASHIPVIMPYKHSLGYKGQWEPKFGLIAIVHLSGEPATCIRLV